MFLPVGGGGGRAGIDFALFIVDRLNDSWINFGNGFLNVQYFLLITSNDWIQLTVYEEFLENHCLSDSKYESIDQGHAVVQASLDKDFQSYP